MIRELKILVSVIFWLQAFVTPVILLGLIWLITGSEKLFIPFMIAGGVIGIVVAEYIRQKIGLGVFFGRIYGSNQMDEKIKKND